MSILNYCGLGAIGCCFRNHRGFAHGPVSSNENGISEENQVCLDTSFMGNYVILLLVFNYLLIYIYNIYIYNFDLAFELISYIDGCMILLKHSKAEVRLQVMCLMSISSGRDLIALITKQL